ncbi:MAG: ABC transporter permease [Phycisphaeraceae bacterium]|nr:ABC transporter permease [Phycisphaeraceae bacterium]
MASSGRNWWWILAGIGGTTLLIAAVTAAQGLGVAAGWAVVAGGSVGLLWGLWGLWHWRTQPTVARLGTMVAATTAAGLLGLLLLLAGRSNGAVAVAGVWSMAAAMGGGVWLLRRLLGGRSAVLAVARTMVDEAIRMKVALVCVGALALLVPVLPMALDKHELLRYRIMFTLSWSLMGVGVILGLMTIFLSCATVAGDLRHRQIYLTLTKPLGRWGYLLGKWVGIMALNALLIVVTGIGVYSFVILLERSGTQRDDYDQQSVRREVLVARVSAQAKPPPGVDFEEVYEQRLKQLREEHPEEFAEVSEHERQNMIAALRAQWHTIEPQNSEAYFFDGLGAAKSSGQPIQLRLHPLATRSFAETVVQVALRINGRVMPTAVYRLADRNVSLIPIPSELVDDQGRLLVEIANVDDPDRPLSGSITFAPGEGIQALYRVGGFEANLGRALAVTWIKLGFLAALGLAAATVLDFPVACLLCLLVYVGASASGFFEQSLADFGVRARLDVSGWRQFLAVLTAFVKGMQEGDVWESLKIPIRMIGQTFMAMVPSLGRYAVAAPVSDGQAVGWSVLGSAALWVGGLWTIGCGLVGWVLFRTRELARVMV